jgi:hypothetical protein
MSGRDGEPAPGTLADDWAEALFVKARESGETQHGKFNGTPMEAYPEDQHAQAVYLRWHYERLLIQIARGTLDVRDVADDKWRTLS